MSNLSKRIEYLPKSIYLKVSKIDELNGRWIGGVNLSPQMLGRLKRSVLATSTGASTRIEGSLLTDEEVERLMRNSKNDKTENRDSQEVRGYYEALQFVFDNYSNIPLDENTILHLHNQLLKYSEKDEHHKGKYKNIDNQVQLKDSDGKVLSILFKTTPAYLTPKAMSELMHWTKEYIDDESNHPLIVISAFIVEFLRIHPFTDGNGRLSRMLTNLILLKTGYSYIPYISLEKIIEDTKSEYYIALRKSQTTFGASDESIVHWSEYFLGILLEQASQAATLLSSEDFEKLLSPNQIKVWEYLNVVFEATPGDISKATGIARPTVSQSIERLQKLKKIERIGQGRTTRYRKITL